MTLFSSPGRRTRWRWRPSTPATIIRLLVLLLIVAVVALPVYLTFASALFPTGEFLRSGLFPPLSHLTLSNLAQAFGAVPLLSQYTTSVIVVILQTAAQLLTSALAAYALVFPQWRAKGVAFGLILLTLAVPGESLTIPNYELVSGMGLRNTIFGIVLPYLAAGYTVFLLRHAFGSLPFEIWEASRLDGCGHLRSLFLIVMPACRAYVATAVLWSALAAWNGFFWPLLITDSANTRTIQVGVAQLVTSEISEPPIVFAGAAIVLIPTVLLVIFSQRLLVNTLASKALR